MYLDRHLAVRDTLNSVERIGDGFEYRIKRTVLSELHLFDTPYEVFFHSRVETIVSDALTYGHRRVILSALRPYATGSRTRLARGPFSFGPSLRPISNFSRYYRNGFSNSLAVIPNAIASLRAAQMSP